MPFIRRLRYYGFLGFNWSPAIAKHMYRHDRRGDAALGIDTSAHDKLHHLKKNGVDTSNATLYMPASYSLLEKTFAQMHHHPKKHFLDIGCGMGRVVCFAAAQGFAKVTGIEFSEKLSTAAKANIQSIGKTAAEAEIITIDARDYEVPGDVDCIFLFNPFDDNVLEEVLRNIAESRQHNPRDISLIYFSEMYADLLQAFGFKKVWEYEELYYLRAAIYKRTA